MTIDKKEVLDVLDYNPETGDFRWKQQQKAANFNKRFIGAVAGTVSVHGYVQIKINNRRYMAHRLAWLVTHGKWPDDHIDHINGITTDNRICNLRSVSCIVNQQNRTHTNEKLQTTSKYLGVSWNKALEKWHSQIKVNGKKVHLGDFDLEIEARDVYLAVKAQLHPGFVPERFPQNKLV